MQDVIQIHPKDNVAVALHELKAGMTVQAGTYMVRVTQNIPQAHKFALQDIPSGSAVVKYGNPIGIAKEDIKAGDWVHVHNIHTGLGDLNRYHYEPVLREEEKDTGCESADEGFMGYRRADGRAGIRNEIWIIPTVGCVNDVVRKIEKLARKATGFEEIHAFNHPYGCSQLGEDQEHTRKILADLIRHPNAGAVLVVGLGCENSNIDVLKEYIGEYDARRVQFLVAQEYEDEVEEGVNRIRELVPYVQNSKQEKISLSELVIGMKCGGSDGLSGITANPSVGRVSDLLIARGGSSILTEVPEMFGAENLLMNRCESREVFDKTVELINHFKEYFLANHQPIYENPSPGNKKGGISTLEDKSLGCTQKSGSAVVRDVLKYGECVKKKGLSLLEAPGNDMVAATTLAAAGAQVVLFTTGRGTPWACPVPTIKISSNSELFAKKKNWIDFDAGTLTQGGSVEKKGEELLQYVIRVASGEKTKSELAGFHDMAIFKQGVTL